MRRGLAIIVACAAVAFSCSKAQQAEPGAPAESRYTAADTAPVQAPAGVEGGQLSVAGPVRVGGNLEQASGPPPASPELRRGQDLPPTGPLPVPKDRKLIRDANALLEVRSLDDALGRLRALVEKSGGYVTNEHRMRDERGARQGMLVARVPAGQLDSLTAALQSVGKVERFQVSAHDITEEYFNLELRLRNQRLLEARLLELLGRAGNRLSDLLETERELARVRSEIDQLEGRQRFWDSRVSLSTLTIELREPRPAVAGEQGGAWAALKKSFSDAADNFVLAVAGIIAATGALIPIVVVFAVVLYGLVRWWRWRRGLPR